MADDYDVQRDIMSDYIAPAMAIGGVAWTGFHAARELSWRDLRAPWRKGRENQRFFGQRGLAGVHAGRAAGRRFAQGRGVLGQTASDAIAMSMDMHYKAPGVGFPTTPLDVQREAWRAAHRKLGLDIPAFPAGQVDRRAGLEAALQGRPELAQEFLGFMRRLPTQAGIGGLGTTFPSGVAGVPRMQKLEFGAFNKAGDWTPGGWTTGVGKDALLDMGKFERPGLQSAMEQLAEAMGKGTQISWAAHPTADVGAVAVRFKSNKAVIEIPLVSFEDVGGRPVAGTMFLGEYGENRVTPRRVARQSEGARYIKDVAGGGPVTAPRMMYMDEYMIEELARRYRDEVRADGARNVQKNAKNIMNSLMKQVIFEGNDYMQRQGSDHVSGFRGMMIRSQVAWVGDDRGFSLKSMTAAAASQGHNINVGPGAAAKNISFMLGVDWGKFTTAGEFTRARPDQLAREMRLSKAMQQGMAGYDIVPRVTGRARASLGQKLQDPLMSMRVAAVNPEAWEFVAKKMGMAANIARIAEEEIVMPAGMRNLEVQSTVGFSHKIDARDLAAGQRLSLIQKLLEQDKALADANAHGRLRDYISGVTNDAMRQDLERLFEFQRGEFVGFNEAGGIITAGEKGGTQKINHVAVDQDGLIRISGDIFHNPTAGFQFKGSKLTKKTLKGFLGDKRFTVGVAQAVAISEHMVTHGVGAEQAFHDLFQINRHVPKFRNIYKQMYAADEGILKAHGRRQEIKRIRKQRRGGGGLSRALREEDRRLSRDMKRRGKAIRKKAMKEFVKQEASYQRVTWRDQGLKRQMMARMAGVSGVTTEGIKSPGTRQMDEIIHSLSEEVFFRTEKGIRPVGMGNQRWARATESAMGKMLGAGYAPGRRIGGVQQWVTSGNIDTVTRHKAVMSAAQDLGILDLKSVGTSLEELFATHDRRSKSSIIQGRAKAQDEAWERLAERYTKIGIYGSEAAAQGTAEMLGAGGQGTTNLRVIQMLRAQGQHEIAAEMAAGTAGKADEFVDLMRQAGVLAGEKPDKVFSVAKIAPWIPNRGEAGGLFSVDPAERRRILEEGLGVRPGESWGIDLGREFDVDGSKVRYLRPGEIASGHVGASVIGQDKEVLKSIDQSLAEVLRHSKTFGKHMGRAQVEEMETRLGTYFSKIGEAVINKRQAGAHAFAGKLANSVQLQYQSGLANKGGAMLGDPHGFFLTESTARKRFNLTKREAHAFAQGTSFGRVVDGAVYGTIHRQPIEGLFRVATTKFLSADRYMKDTNTSHELRSALKDLSDAQIFANESFDPILGADKDGDQVYAHALDPKNKLANDLARGTAETRIKLSQYVDPNDVNPDDVRDMLRGMSLQSNIKMDDFVERSLHMGTLQDTYMRMQAEFSKHLKAPGDVPHTLTDAFVKGTEAFVSRQTERYVEMELEKQVIGHVSNAADVAFLAYTKRTTDPRKIMQAGALLGNLSERVLKGKYFSREHIQQGSELAMEMIGILREGRFTDSQRFHELAEQLFNPQGEEGKRLVADVLEIGDDLLRSVHEFRTNNPEFDLTRQLRRQDAEAGTLRNIHRLINDAGNDHPLAVYYRSRMQGSGAMGAVKGAYSMARNALGTNVGQIAGAINRNRIGAAVGLGAAVLGTMMFGDPGDITAKGDNLARARLEAQPRDAAIGGVPPATPFPRNARVMAGLGTEARAVATQNLDIYTMSNSLGASMGGSSSINIQMSDRRAHVNEDYIMNRMGI